MCNRYNQGLSAEELAKAFGARLLSNEPLSHTEIFPKRKAAVVRKEAGERVIDVMTWGFPPPAAGRAPVTNVRNLSSPFWRSALANPARRCLVPVTDFCEWSGEKGSKTEHWFSVHEAPVFAFAGIWQPIQAGKSYAFLTCEPNQLVETIHPKAMPVILDPNDYDRWLDGEVSEVCSLATPFPSQLMRVSQERAGERGS